MSGGLVRTRGGDWVNQRGDTRPPLIRAPRWALRLWKAVDHARYVRRYGHAELRRSDGRLAAHYQAMKTGIVDGAVADGERQTVRKAGR